jgi:RNA polymerase sigma-70 factor (TIGR02943 family)
MDLSLVHCAVDIAESCEQTQMTPDVVGFRDQLMRFAKSRLRNDALAEDAVSETVLAALNAGSRFTSQSQARAWMFGVLRHKLVDQWRQQVRELPSGDLGFATESDNDTWLGAGFWCGGRPLADDPEQACQQRQFFELLATCCKRLPSIQARAFIMREVRGLESDIICLQLEVTESHLWVLLHRARQRLRTLLGQHWQIAAHPLTRPGRPTPSR